MVKKGYPQCSRCPTKACENRGQRADAELHPLEKAPGFCPMKLMPEDFSKALAEYDSPDLKEFARLASVQEGQCLERLPDGFRAKLPRIEELIQFARKCGYKRLGIAYCGGLANEARMLTDILENNGFEVISVQCKAGAVPKERIGVKPEEKIAGTDKWETMCNPVAQAMIINNSGVDMAIMLGLCIGHDTIFIKYCNIPLTILAVKDRVFGHNPLAALYTSGSYYHRLTGKII